MEFFPNRIKAESQTMHIMILFIQGMCIHVYQWLGMLWKSEGGRGLEEQQSCNPEQHVHVQ